MRSEKQKKRTWEARNEGAMRWLRAVLAGLGAGFVMAGVGWRVVGRSNWAACLVLGIAGFAVVLILCLPDRKQD